jgi:MFS family permease
MRKGFKAVYREFPRLFWYVVLARFVDGLGGTLLFPFFALYITQRFGVGMTQAGVLIGLSSFFGLAGSTAGGALADRFGRRRLILFGLVFSALSSLSFGLATDIRMLYGLIVAVGLLSSVAHPAHEAMLADILPSEKRQEGFAILRTVFNAAWIFGTALGGLIAARSFFALFVIDSVLSCLVAAFLFRVLPETRPRAEEDHASSDSLLKTFVGYRLVLRDLGFVAFVAAGMLALIVYQQQYSTLGVYLRDYHQIDTRGYGAILSVTGLQVVLLQFWISRQVRGLPPFTMLALGAVLFGAGFLMYGLVNGFWMFMLAAVVVCMGEMLYFPISQAVAAGFAPGNMRGRYMAVAHLSWTIPATVGPAAAGILLDHFRPSLMWYVGSLLCVLAAASYALLHLRLGSKPQFTAMGSGQTAPP